MQDTTDAIRRIEASMRILDDRMRRAAGDLDYETHLHEKRALAAAAPHTPAQAGRGVPAFQSKFSIIG